MTGAGAINISGIQGINSSKCMQYFSWNKLDLFQTNPYDIKMCFQEKNYVNHPLYTWCPMRELNQHQYCFLHTEKLSMNK